MTKHAFGVKVHDDLEANVTNGGPHRLVHRGPVSQSLEKVREQLLWLSTDLRGIGLDAQADCLREIADDLLPPDADALLANLIVPRAWVTREHSRWLAERLSAAYEVIVELIEDARITGSRVAVGKSRAWLESLGLNLPVVEGDE